MTRDLDAGTLQVHWDDHRSPWIEFVGLEGLAGRIGLAHQGSTTCFDAVRLWGDPVED